MEPHRTWLVVEWLGFVARIGVLRVASWFAIVGSFCLSNPVAGVVFFCVCVRGFLFVRGCLDFLKSKVDQRTIETRKPRLEVSKLASSQQGMRGTLLAGENVGMNPGFGPLNGNHQLDGQNLQGQSISIMYFGFPFKSKSKTKHRAR